MSSDLSPPSSSSNPVADWVKGFFNVNTRLSRMGFVFQFLVIVALVIGLKLLGHQLSNDPTRLPNSLLLLPADLGFLFLYLVLSFFPVVRRAHDFGMSGFVYFFTILPAVNVIAIVFLALKPGTPGPNEWGESVRSGNIEELAEQESSGVAAP